MHSIYLKVVLAIFTFMNLAKGSPTGKRPNIVIFLSDDQDIMLGSMDVMRKTHNRVINRGATFNNAFTTSPICCPSRSSFLTGLYSHNHHVLTNNDNCSSPAWQRQFENGTFATYLNKSGYTTGYFGKYLNEYDGNHVPAGWQYWMGLVRNTKYYNYTLKHNGKKEKHGDDYAKDYLTDLVANRSAAHFRTCKELNPDKPILSVLSFPAPHGKEDGAPQYQHLYNNVTSHITPSFNYVPNPDKHWLLQQFKEPMDETQHRFSVLLQQKRLQTLRSVDDAVEKFVSMLEEIGELDNTYIIYTSDHGFHIGQFGLAKGKSMPYDFDIRVPLYMRGPGITPGLHLDNVVLNIDMAPTILALAGIEAPKGMDGRNFMPLISSHGDHVEPRWRHSFLVERGKIPTTKHHLDRPAMKTKQYFVDTECKSPKYRHPCEKKQIWTCVPDELGALKFRKCNKFREPKPPRRNPKKCFCPVNDPTMPRAILRLSKKCKSRLTRIYQRIGQVSAEKVRSKSRRGARFPPKSRRASHRRGSRYSERSYYGRAKRQLLDPAMSVQPSNITLSLLPLLPGCEINPLTNAILCNRPPSSDRRWKQRVHSSLEKSIQQMYHKIKYMRTVQRCTKASRAQFNNKPRVKVCKCSTSTPVAPKLPQSSESNPNK